MQRFKYTIVLFCFIVWIMPIGAFISAAQSKIACNGQRAICMCPHLLAKLQEGMVGKMLIKAPPLSKVGAPSMSPEFLLPNVSNNTDQQDGSNFLPYLNPFNHQTIVRLIDHVPKV